MITLRLPQPNTTPLLKPTTRQSAEWPERSEAWLRPNKLTTTQQSAEWPERSEATIAKKAARNT
jgi:hypothetical protein